MLDPGFLAQIGEDAAEILGQAIGGVDEAEVRAGGQRQERIDARLGGVRPMVGGGVGGLEDDGVRQRSNSLGVRRRFRGVIYKPNQGGEAPEQAPTPGYILKIPFLFKIIALLHFSRLGPYLLPSPTVSLMYPPAKPREDL